MPENIQRAVQSCQAFDSLFIVTRMDETRVQIVESGDDAVAQSKLLIARQAIEQRHIPEDQVVRLLDD